MGEMWPQYIKRVVVKELIVSTVQSACETICLEFVVEIVNLIVERNRFQPKRSL